MPASGQPQGEGEAQIVTVPLPGCRPAAELRFDDRVMAIYDELRTWEFLSLECAAATEPAAGAVTGGDWWDVINLPQGLVGLAFGDAMGHGEAVAPSALALASVIRAVASEGHDPDLVMASVRRLACRRGLMATVFFALMDVTSGSLRYCSAGHPPPVVISNRSCSMLPLVAGPPLGSGWEKGESWGETRLGRDDLIICYSDGLAGRDGVAGPELIRALSEVSERDFAPRPCAGLPWLTVRRLRMTVRCSP